jgi:pilus assembly protein Flp/PilA
MRGLTRIIRCERGANAIEYALVASLIAITAIVGINNVANKMGVMYNNVENHL